MRGHVIHTNYVQGLPSEESTNLFHYFILHLMDLFGNNFFFRKKTSVT